MSNAEIERRLRALEPLPPRPGVRERVLQRVRGELAGPREGPFDRFLARRMPWLAAVALLLLLIAASVVLERGAERRRLDRRAAIEADARSVVAYRAWLARHTAGDRR